MELEDLNDNLTELGPKSDNEYIRVHQHLVHQLEIANLLNLLGVSFDMMLPRA